MLESKEITAPTEAEAVNLQVSLVKRLNLHRANGAPLACIIMPLHSQIKVWLETICLEKSVKGL